MLKCIRTTHLVSILSCKYLGYIESDTSNSVTYAEPGDWVHFLAFITVLSLVGCDVRSRTKAYLIREAHEAID